MLHTLEIIWTLVSQDNSLRKIYMAPQSLL